MNVPGYAKNAYLCGIILINETMKKTKKQKETVENEVVPEEKKSKIRLYWEDRDRRGVPEGQILNMRAVLK